MESKHFPNEYWVEVVTTVVYIMNWCPTKSMDDHVPQEAWICMTQKNFDLKVFGRVAFAHV